MRVKQWLKDIEKTVNRLWSDTLPIVYRYLNDYWTLLYWWLDEHNTMSNRLWTAALFSFYLVYKSQRMLNVSSTCIMNLFILFVYEKFAQLFAFFVFILQMRSIVVLCHYGVLRSKEEDCIYIEGERRVLLVDADASFYLFESQIKHFSGNGSSPLRSSSFELWGHVDFVPSYS